jgi:acid phosphatase type 7
MTGTLLLRRFVVALSACLAWSMALPTLAQEVVVMPYVQPGDGRFLTGTDVKIIHWFTDQVPGEFVVEYQTPGGLMRVANPSRMTLDFAAVMKAAKADKAKDKVKSDKAADKDKADQSKDADKKKADRAPVPAEKDQHYFKYTADLSELPFNSDVRYRVRLGDRVVREATFRTRSTADESVRCVLVGDMAQGREQQKPIAYAISKQNPAFLVALGDIVYPDGRVSQYASHYWSTYNNVSEASPKTGAPLMASVPFYAVLGNHDVNAKLPGVPDALAAYYFFTPPKGGPGEGPWITPLGKDKAVEDKFREHTRDSYPNLDHYSFDNGPAHFVAINDNRPMDIGAPAFRKWLEDDLKSTKAKWKFVCFHIPGFQSSITHYPEQQLRFLEPLFEECGVDIAFGGHVHNYQRSMPLKFALAPDEKFAVPPIQKKVAPVNGTFTLDKEFDGVKNTKPKGVIHIVAGGGGASLYGPGLEETAPKLRKDYADNNFVDFTSRMVVTDHSFVVLDLAPDRLQLRALNSQGEELDNITITK